MKKFFCIILSLTCLNLFGQELSVLAANRKTAQRCLQLAEKYILTGDYQAAYNQAEMGLSYDETISDLVYIKATSQNHLNVKRAVILENAKKAIELDNWINNNKNNARMLYADMLCETCDSAQALNVLNQAPVIYAADAEFIRIKALYRIGTSDSIKEARLKIDTARRIYPKDERFPYLFFMFETLFYKDAMMKGLEYNVPANVQKIALDYIVKLPDYTTHRIEMEIMASFFTPGEFYPRLLKATGEKTNQHSLYATAALKAGVMSEEKAFNLFFDNLGESVKLIDLEAFASLIQDPDLKENLKHHIDSFEGTLLIDENLDLIDELKVEYVRGRPAYIHYDANNDEEKEIYAACDFGTPLMLNFAAENMVLYYDIYPYVEKIEDNANKAFYSFVGTDFYYTPFEMTIDKVFTDLGLEFYIPYVNEEYTSPEYSYMLLNCSQFVVEVEERPGATANYSLIAGRPHSINFYDEEKQLYAWTVVQEGFPFVRYVDYDNDEILETTEYFAADEEQKFQTAADVEIVKKIFGVNYFGQDFYLQKIRIDRDNDGIAEFSEEYLENQGKISSWDNDGNGIWDYEFIRYPQKENEPLVEETIFYNSNGMEYVSVTDINSSPVKVTVNKEAKKVIEGAFKNTYWIAQKEDSAVENAILAQSEGKLGIGAVMLVDLKTYGRFSVIKIGKNIFIRKLPASDTELNIMTETR